MKVRISRSADTNFHSYDIKLQCPSHENTRAFSLCESELRNAKRKRCDGIYIIGHFSLSFFLLIGNHLHHE
jgi:hypothetical protein